MQQLVLVDPQATPATRPFGPIGAPTFAPKSTNAHCRRVHPHCTRASSDQALRSGHPLKGRPWIDVWIPGSYPGWAVAFRNRGDRPGEGRDRPIRNRNGFLKYIFALKDAICFSKLETLPGMGQPTTGLFGNGFGVFGMRHGISKCDRIQE